MPKNPQLVRHLKELLTQCDALSQVLRRTVETLQEQIDSKEAETDDDLRAGLKKKPQDDLGRPSCS